MKSTRPKMTPGKKRPAPPRPNSEQDLTARDAVQVYCRVRPMSSQSDFTCAEVRPPSTIVLTPPEQAINFKIGMLRETQYTFKHVFGTDATQRQMYNTIAQPLVENLVRGRNSLLFTYGVTGSGKTYTMTGDNRDRGIMPRCLDVLFKTISDYQTKKFIFKPDRLNGFEILSDVDAMLERQADMQARFAGSGRKRHKNSDPEVASQASTDVSGLNAGCLDEDNMYAVFITYVEVYNNSVFDLLEDSPIQKTLQSKIVREDANHNMFVHGVKEVEVKTVEEALEMFTIGQKRKRMGHTILNAESSRSHSVFTIRLVQAPTDAQGENIVSCAVTVSQLSLVDLAGSERTNRTKNSGQRLREAGNINNSLMTLRTCLEILRENQLNTAGHGLPVQLKKVPYRDAKITHLFKNYFDGEGQVRMIICINPRAEDYDETVHVMKFAEMSQEVQINRPAISARPDLGLTPGRRKANQLYKIAVNNLVDECGRDLGDINRIPTEIDLGMVYNLGPKIQVQNIELNSDEAKVAISELMITLEKRIQKRQMLLSDFDARLDYFRTKLLDREKELLALSSENASLKAVLKQEQNRATSLESKCVRYESSIDELNRKLRDREERLHDVEQHLNQKQQLLTAKEIEKEKQRLKFSSKIAVEKDKLKNQMENELRSQATKMNHQMRVKDEKLRLVSNILNSENIVPTADDANEDFITPRMSTVTPQMSATTTRTESRTPRHGGVAANNRHRRSRSTGDRWLEHRATNPVPLGTIFQPFYKNRKSITKLTDPKELTDARTSKYCLVSQQADTDGEVETKLYKGEVIPTTGGGAQVVFNDIELLKQLSPDSCTPRKRPSQNDEVGIPAHEVASRCSLGIECRTPLTQSNKKKKV